MTESYTLSLLLNPLVAQFNPHSLLIAGDIAAASVKSGQDTRLQQLTTPFNQQQLRDLKAVDLAVISDLTETLPLNVGQQWLGYLRNVHAPHVILISDANKAAENGWQLRDYLAMGLQHVAGTKVELQIYSYAIENYQPRRDWLNSRFWANPENYDKYRW